MLFQCAHYEATNCRATTFFPDTHFQFPLNFDFLKKNIKTQVSQYTFAICSYKEKKTDPSEMMSLVGYTVDYIEPAGGKSHTRYVCYSVHAFVWENSICKRGAFVSLLMLFKEAKI